jgi:hypothetical protein
VLIRAITTSGGRRHAKKVNPGAAAIGKIPEYREFISAPMPPRHDA